MAGVDVDFICKENFYKGLILIKFILLSLCITTALFSQSLEDKISQMLMVGFPGNELTDSTYYK